MDGSSHNYARPLAVKFALIPLGFNVAVALVMSVVYTRWMDLWSEITFWLFLLFSVLPFCFLVLGKTGRDGL